MGQIIYDIDNVTRTLDSKMLGRRWKMTREGLACVDCKGIKDDWEEGDEDIDELLQQELEDKQRALEMEQRRLEMEMEKRQLELEKIEDELEREMDDSEEFEEASTNSEEIILKRVINASFRIDPTTLRKVRFSYPG